jgi:hypothetical protein
MISMFSPAIAYAVSRALTTVHREASRDFCFA